MFADAFEYITHYDKDAWTWTYEPMDMWTHERGGHLNPWAWTYGHYGFLMSGRINMDQHEHPHECITPT